MRAVFSNQGNAKGFPGFKNANLFFEGRTALEVMTQGDLISLYVTYQRIEQLSAARQKAVEIDLVCG